MLAYRTLTLEKSSGGGNPEILGYFTAHSVPHHAGVSWRQVCSLVQAHNSQAPVFPQKHPNFNVLPSLKPNVEASFSVPGS